MSVAVLDVGKTNVKVVLFDDSGALLAERSRANVALPPDAEWPYPRLDLEANWAFLLASLAELDAVAPIATISISAHGGAGVMIDDAGAAPPAMDYEFAGFGALDAEYDAIRPPFDETLSPRAPGGLNVGRCVYFYERRYPDLFAKAQAFLMYPQYWLWRLTGALASEVTSLACHADLWRPREARLSSLVESRGWTRLFPPLRHAWDAFPIRPEIAAAAGLSPSTRVLVGAHDSNLSLVPHIVSRKGAFSVVSTGTWVILMAVGGAGPLDPDWDMLANVDVTGRPTPCARFMGGREYAVLAGERPAPVGPDDIAAVVAAGTLALPAFSDQGGPFAAIAGAVEGPPPETPRGPRRPCHSLCRADEQAHARKARGARRLDRRGRLRQDAGVRQRSRRARAGAPCRPRRDHRRRGGRRGAACALGRRATAGGERRRRAVVDAGPVGLCGALAGGGDGPPFLASHAANGCNMTFLRRRVRTRRLRTRASCN